MALSSIRESRLEKDTTRSALLFTFFLMVSSYSAMQFGIWEALASTDQDGDGLSYGIEFIINTQPEDWDSDNDGLPDGWEWQYGLDPLSASGDNGSNGDPDSDAFSNLNEYLFGIPQGWDVVSTSNVLDNGVWWNGTVPVSNWDEESAMQIIQGAGSDGFDEDPIGNICADTFDNDHDGSVDSNDDDGDGDADCLSDDDDGDGEIDEDPNGWDTDGDGMPDGWEWANGLDPTSNSNQDGTYGDPDSDGLANIYEYVNPTWGTRNGTTFPPTQYFRPGPLNMTATESPCNPVLLLGPGGCQIFTAEVDGITQTDPQNPDTDGDGLNDSFEALVLLTDPTSIDTDSDGIEDGTEVNATYGDPAQASDPRNNNTDGDHLEDGEEDLNGNGVIDPGETDPTRINDEGDFDGDGLQNWEENMSCTLWDVADSDGGGVNDGDEASMFHNTDPCTSFVELNFTIQEWDAAENSITLNSTEGLNPNPNDWRQNGAPMAFFQSPDGHRTPFQFFSIQFGELRGLDITKPDNATEVVFINGSWCWDPSAGTNNSPHCDDDYADSDGDGLADWEELLGTWGYFSRPDLFDTDGDGVGDLSEIQNNTDPREPCHNLLDSDGDGLNNFFENTTGCDLFFGIAGSNLTLDPWLTLWDVADTDEGGINDGQEYIDGTNPQNNPDDDINPYDSDGDGIPDSIENETGTDWRDPDTDGGGIPDGEECTQEFWASGCLTSDQNPFDPTDDILAGSLFFTAKNLSVGMDPTATHYWRWHTYDSYTGISWGVNTSLLGNTPVLPEWSTSEGLADQSLWNHTAPLNWEILYDQAGYAWPGQELIQPFNSQNFSSWADFSAGLNMSNFTRDIIVDTSTIEALYVSAPEVIFSTAIMENTTVFSGSDYAKDLPPGYLENSGSLVSEITQSVINDSGALSAWGQISAIQDFLINGNETITFLRNHNGSRVPDSIGDDGDVSHWILNSSFEGSCDEFTTVFAVMLRSAGFPARKVTGFSGGIWDGEHFTVYGNNFTRWVEVHLETNQNQGNLDLGWVPFQACPEMSLVQLNGIETGPSSIDRNVTISDTIWLEATLLFQSNLTVASNINVSLYLVPPEEAKNIPGRSALSSRLVGTATTNGEGFFNITGLPQEVVRPGYASLVALTAEHEYVGVQGLTVPSLVNISDNVSISVSSPPPSSQPMLGVGVNSTISGYLSWASSPFLDPSMVDDLEVYLNYTSQIEGDVNISSAVGGGGYFEFTVPINESEPLGVINSTINFYGWHEGDLNNASSPSFHAIPKSFALPLNITPSPDLIVSLQSNGTNNSVLEIDEPIFLNGSVLSRGDSPAPLNGTLILEMRRADLAGPYTTLKTWYLNDSSLNSSNGQFSVNWSFGAADVPLTAGPVDVRLQFDSDDYFANDQEQFSEEFGIRSYMQFNYTLNPTPRGIESNAAVFLSDHTGTSFSSFEGNYTLDFDGEIVWNQTDPETGKLAVTWTPAWDLVAADYSWTLNYNGSTWLKPASTSSTIRVFGIANVTASLNQEWTPIGGTNWVSGLARDMVLDSTVLGNNSSVSLVLEVPSKSQEVPGGFPAAPDRYELSTGWIDPSNGQYNLSFQLPSGIHSGAYSMYIKLDFTRNPPPGGFYYSVSEGTIVPVGLQSEFVVQTDPTDVILVSGQALEVEVTVTDVEDDSFFVSGANLDLYFDWGGPQQQLLASETTDNEGLAQFNPIIPESVAPGLYQVRIHANDDLADNVTNEGAGRWLGNESFVNLTVQVPSLIQIQSLPNSVLALQQFTIEGTVLDSLDQNRTLQGPVGVEVFFLDKPEEKLISNHTTESNGSFNVTVPTDVLGDGVSRGQRTVVVSVVNGSTPFYLTSTGAASILVIGITSLVDSNPFINTVFDRGETVSISTRLVEFSDNSASLPGQTVMAKFHDTWLTPGATGQEGTAFFTFTIPSDHPLGLVNVTLFYNGSSDLNPSVSILSTITVRSQVIMEIDPIFENPLAGTSFNVTGTLVSDNGSSLAGRSGSLVNPAITMAINGDSAGFSILGLNYNQDGSWSAIVRLELNFQRGSHVIETQFTPDVTFFSSSSAIGIFDSRGFSLLTITDPTDLDPDSRTVRGETISVNLSLVDNSDNPVPSAVLTIEVDGSVVWGGLSNQDGEATATITVRADIDPGPMRITAKFSGVNGTTGMEGDEFWTRVIVLAPTNLRILDFSSPSVVGGEFVINGTLLDELDRPLFEGGEISGGIIHLSIDGNYTGSAYSVLSNASDGSWSISYDVPMDMDFGPHQISVEFLGGFTWVDPMGQGDSLNPEYYLGSSDSDSFDVFQISQVSIITQPGEVDRSELLVVQGRLVDGVSRPLPDRSMNIVLDGELFSGMTTTDEGFFNAQIPIPPDADLGPMEVSIEFPGEEFVLPSSSSLIMEVFGPVSLSIDEIAAVAVSDTLYISGNVKDNLPDGWLANHTVEVFVDGALIGISSSDGDGIWSISWEVPETMSVGNHSLSAFAPAQGFHREDSHSVSFTVSYHTELNIEIVNPTETRGSSWNFSGRLYESDTGFDFSLDGREVEVFLDGNPVGSLITEVGGIFNYSVPVGFPLSRGIHNVTFSYGGEHLYLPSTSTTATYAKSDIYIETQPISSSIIRGNSSHPIMIQGVVRELGGDSSIIEDLSISLQWGDNSLTIEGSPWSNPLTQNFQIRAEAQEFLMPGENTIKLIVEPDANRFLNGAFEEIEIMVLIEVDFEFSSVGVSTGQRVISGTVNVTARDTQMPVEGISMSAILMNGSSTHFSMTKLTNSEGVFEYEFKSLSPLPPLSDESSWGVLSIKLGSDSEFLDSRSLALLPSEGILISYAEEEDDFGLSSFGLVIALLVAAGLATAMVSLLVSRRKASAIKELAGIFSQTAEMLSAGDEFRKAIFECYQNLCNVLTKRGFLRRNFETVREFEMAIRKALPISDASLVALDRIFEEARYSSHVLGNLDRENAQISLSNVVSEIESLQEIPTRNIQEIALEE